MPTAAHHCARSTMTLQHTGGRRVVPVAHAMDERGPRRERSQSIGVGAHDLTSLLPASREEARNSVATAPPPGQSDTPSLTAHDRQQHAAQAWSPRPRTSSQCLVLGRSRIRCWHTTLHGSPIMTRASTPPTTPPSPNNERRTRRPHVGPECGTLATSPPHPSPD